MEEAYTADHSILEAKYQLNGEKKKKIFWILSEAILMAILPALLLAILQEYCWLFSNIIDKIAINIVESIKIADKVASNIADQQYFQ